MADPAALHAIGPTHVSPGWLSYLLDQYVPQTIELPDEARAGLRPAVTAWVRWAAGQRDLTAEAIEALTVGVADPEMTALRCYLWDVVTTTVDGEDLRRAILPAGQRPCPCPATGNPKTGICCPANPTSATRSWQASRTPPRRPHGTGHRTRFRRAGVHRRRRREGHRRR